MLVLFFMIFPYPLKSGLDMKPLGWETSEDEIQTTILGKIKTQLGRKIQGGHKSSETGQEPGTHKPKVK